MKLAKYLADYIEHEMADNSYLTMEESIQQGIEAFASTEDVTVEVYETDSYKVKEQYS